jgi:hypothetical protein
MMNIFTLIVLYEDGLIALREDEETEEELEDEEQDEDEDVDS